MGNIPHTVGDILSALNMVSYSHIVLQEKTPQGLMPLGGGSPSSVYLRYGKMYVCECRVENNILYMVVS